MSLNLPSSHGGGVLPGNHNGLSGSAATQTVTDLTPVDVTFLLTLSFLPDKNEAFVALVDERATAAMVDEAQAGAAMSTDFLLNSVCEKCRNENQN